MSHGHVFLTSKIDLAASGKNICWISAGKSSYDFSLRVNDGAKVDDIHCEQVLIPTTFGPLSTSMPRPTKQTPTENMKKEGSQKESKRPIRDDPTG